MTAHYSKWTRSTNVASIQRTVCTQAREQAMRLITIIIIQTLFQPRGTRCVHLHSSLSTMLSVLTSRATTNNLSLIHRGSTTHFHPHTSHPGADHSGQNRHAMKWGCWTAFHSAEPHRKPMTCSTGSCSLCPCLSHMPVSSSSASCLTCMRCNARQFVRRPRQLVFGGR